MTEEQIQRLLKKVWAQTITAEEALEELRHLPFEELSYARVDNHRALRCGFPEVIFCQGKEPSDITEISRAILRSADHLLATRAGPQAFQAIHEVDTSAHYHERARCVTVTKSAPVPHDGRVVIACAGTADVPVAEEARVTAEIMGHEVDAIYDVGVAGIHRLLAHRERLTGADAIVVVAGMEGALASVVGGLTDAPVVAVPTSVGYGANFGGLAPLLTMLNSCAAGVLRRQHRQRIRSRLLGGFDCAPPRPTSLVDGRWLLSGRTRFLLFPRGRVILTRARTVACSSWPARQAWPVPPSSRLEEPFAPGWGWSRWPSRKTS